MAIVEKLYALKLEDFQRRIQEMTNPYIIYVTDLVSCSNKRVMRRHYPLLSFRFEPPLILGELVHTGIQSLLTGTGEWKAEVEVRSKKDIDDNEYEIVGRVDLVRYEGEKPIEVVEVKTVRQLQDNVPYEHHVMQLKIYLEMLGVESGYLLYITPDRIVEYNIERNNLNLDELIRQTVYNLAKPRYAWECRYCPYKRICPYARSEG